MTIFFFQILVETSESLEKESVEFLCRLYLQFMCFVPDY
jgi:hypothetical protein